MKPIITILFLLTFSVFSINSFCQSQNNQSIKRQIENLNLLNDSLFPKRNLINVKIENIWEVFDSLPTITGIKYFEESNSRYYSNQTFNDNFKVYLIALAGDGDCLSGMNLIICKENSIISMIEASHTCGWETGSTKKYIIFTTDTTFSLVTESKLKPTFSDTTNSSTKYECKKIVEKYKIASNGELVLLEKSENSYTENT